MDCPAKKGWFCHKESESIVSRCGASKKADGSPSGSHTLEIRSISEMLKSEGLNAELFEKWWQNEFEKFEKKPLIDMMDAYLKGSPDGQSLRRDYEVESARVKKANANATYYYALGFRPQSGSYSPVQCSVCV